MNRVFYKKFDVYIGGHYVPNVELVDIAVRFYLPVVFCSCPCYDLGNNITVRYKGCLCTKNLKYVGPYNGKT